MRSWTRRSFCVGAGALSAVPLLFKNGSAAGATAQSAIAQKAQALSSVSPVSVPLAGVPKPLVHVTDLYRPHEDPDDHWDLATAFALAWRGALDLQGILIDNPENIEEMPERLKVLAGYADGGMHVARGPDVAAVAQLNYLSSRAVPVTTGTIWPIRPGEKVRTDNLPKDLNGVAMLLEILRRSSQPVAITIGGSCQDVAIAGKKDGRLFSEKCAGIYVNAGVGTQSSEKQRAKNGDVEWNVSLNRGAYAAMFELPCPIYWMPCFKSLSGTESGQHGAFWSFRQKEVLPYLSNRMQAYFAYVLSKECGTNWLSYLLDSNSKERAQKYFDDERGMFCTAGFLHAAGKTVTMDGEIVPLEAAGKDAVYEFTPISVRCDENGITEWQETKSSTNRHIFYVRDKDNYPKAMLTALKSILVELP